MEQLLTFLSKPIVLTVVTLAVGSYLFTRLTERRSKRQKIQDSALELLEDVGNDLNAVLSLCYGHIKRSDFKIGKASSTNQSKDLLFTRRFSVRIKSRAFLQSDTFSERYDELAFEISDLIKLMRSLSQPYGPEGLVKVTETIKERRARLANSWPRDEKEDYPKYPPPADELVIWADMIWDRAFWLISTHLQLVLK